MTVNEFDRAIGTLSDMCELAFQNGAHLDAATYHQNTYITIFPDLYNVAGPSPSCLPSTLNSLLNPTTTTVAGPSSSHTPSASKSLVHANLSLCDHKRHPNPNQGCLLLLVQRMRFYRHEKNSYSADQNLQRMKRW